MGITRRGFLQAAAGALVLRGVLRVSAEEGPRGLLSVPHPQYARSLGNGAFLVSWITDSGLSRLSVVSKDGTRDWAQTGSGPGALCHPQGVCLDEDGVAYVCDSRNGRIAVFDADGNPCEPIGRMGFLPGQFHLPQGCDLRRTTLAVADAQNHRVQLIDTLTHDVQCVIGRLGDGKGELRRPTDVAFLDDDTLWVLDAGHGRALRYSVDGKLQDELVVGVGAQGLMVHPKEVGGGAGVSAHNEFIPAYYVHPLVVSDTRKNRVVIDHPDGPATWTIDGLVSPRGVCLDGEGRIVICESGADRLSVFETPWR